MVSAQQGQHTLIVNSGPNTGQTYILNDIVSTMGRSADNTIVLDSTRVSRYHVKISILPTGVMIEDTGSTNGTFVNGQQITAQYTLSSGDIIGIADYITFQYVVESIMGVGINQPPVSRGGSTQIMNAPGAFSAPTNPAPMPQIATYAPEFQSRQPNTYMPAPASRIPQAPAKTPTASKKRPSWLYGVIGLLVILICACVALAIFLWFAPESFWRDVFDLLKIPWPSMLVSVCITVKGYREKSTF